MNELVEKNIEQVGMDLGLECVIQIFDIDIDCKSYRMV